MNKQPALMKAIELIGHGGLEKLCFSEEVITPTPEYQQVLVRVRAAGVNNTDINTRIGWYSKGENDSQDASWGGKPLTFPLIQGADVCGQIVAVGEGVSSRRLGERVLVEPCMSHIQGQLMDQPWYLGSECNGGFAEYVVVDARHAYAIESYLTDIELASFPCSYSTAENMLTRAQVSQHDRVVITGASGGVGSAAIQLAKARGASVVAVTSESKTSQILALGADQVAVRDKSLVESLGSNSVDVVIDLVAGDAWPQLLEVLKPKGRYAVSGAIGGALVEMDVRTLYLKDLSFFGCTVLEPEVFGNLVNLIQQGKIQPLIAKSFPLRDIKKAQRFFLEKNHVGKVVLSIE
ncbi:alcohol dehydrogenase family protein [Vibrio coralliilyticus]|uniref:alcohol dehydrogenase family protein n=1 Tax=Vibrio coralliilyticus TaxID=190893 RepID=UPI001E409796|nr:alcohol dehydrogenase family protein [Vibrio coralliilyticus]MCC2521446.1 alcohol dehydrogenase family protein [Vibrio coralliilyticus]